MLVLFKCKKDGTFIRQYKIRLADTKFKNAIYQVYKPHYKSDFLKILGSGSNIIYNKNCAPTKKGYTQT